MDCYTVSSLNNNSRHSNATSWSRAIHSLLLLLIAIYWSGKPRFTTLDPSTLEALHHRYTQHQQKLSKLNMNKHSIKHIINISIRKVLWYKRGNQKRLFEKGQAIAKRKRTKKQTIIDKIPHRKLKIEQHEHHKNTSHEWPQALRKGPQFLI